MTSNLSSRHSRLLSLNDEKIPVCRLAILQIFVCAKKGTSPTKRLMTMEFDKDFLGKLFEQATMNPRLRQSFDLRTSSADTSQRMLIALLPGTVVPIHRHEDTTESVICLCGKFDVVIYEEVVTYEKSSSDAMPMGMDAQDVTRKVEYREVQRIHLCPAEAKYGCQIPKGAWHTVEVIEPSVIFEAKDGAYGEDGSETAKA